MSDNKTERWIGSTGYALLWKCSTGEYILSLHGVEEYRSFQGTIEWYTPFKNYKVYKCKQSARRWIANNL